jgi:hypothetical protein
MRAALVVLCTALALSGCERGFRAPATHAPAHPRAYYYRVSWSPAALDGTATVSLFRSSKQRTPNWSRSVPARVGSLHVLVLEGSPRYLLVELATPGHATTSVRLYLNPPAQGRVLSITTRGTPANITVT